MRARVPQDVDLEDKLVYGLTPIRFGYLVIAGLGAISVWNLRLLPAPLRLLACLLVAGGGVLLVWGRWRGRPPDRLLADAVVFLRRNYRLGMGFSRRRSVQLAPLPLAAVNALAATQPGQDPER